MRVMRALTVRPGTKDSLAVSDVPEPAETDGSLLVEGIALGICGTDLEIARGEYGFAPPGDDHLVIGHESLGRVLEAPAGSGFAAGDLVAGIVRRPDPVPCSCCATGRWDMCRNGRYVERGIKERHGYGSQRWRVEPEFAVALPAGFESFGVLLEPTSVVTKAWDQVDRVSASSCAPAERVLVTGAGPIGLLAALLAVQRGLETHVLDLQKEGVKPRLARELGATYHSGAICDLDLQPDVIIECTGAGQVVFDAMEAIGPGGVLCLTGVSPKGRRLEIDAGAINSDLVLENNVVVGSVNAAARHYDGARDALAAADQSWLEALITRRVGLEDAPAAFDRREHDIKVVVEL
jgi:threonine dehydrogenase-like Zn-dependent dehydrogenase